MKNQRHKQEDNGKAELEEIREDNIEAAKKTRSRKQWRNTEQRREKIEHKYSYYIANLPY